MIKIENRD